MAIDPKNLRLGSHVNVNGVRARVIKIDEPTSNEIPPYVILRFTALIGGELRECGGFPHDDKINPIPITEELLTELGFEKTEFHGKPVYRKLYKDVSPLGKMYYGLFCNANAEAWHFQVHTTDSECRYLHELEALAYHVTKEELIND